MITTKIEEEWFRTVFFRMRKYFISCKQKKIKISKSEKILLILYEKKRKKSSALSPQQR